MPKKKPKPQAATLDIFGEPVLPEPPEDQVEKGPALFDFVSAIQHTKQDIFEEGQYNPFMVNRALSFAADTVMYANEMNVRNDVSKRMHFDYLRFSIRARKRFDRWAKKDVDTENVSVVKEFYRFSHQKAQEVVRFLTDDDIAEMKKTLQPGGMLTR